MRERTPPPYHVDMKAKQEMGLGPTELDLKLIT